MVKRIVAMVMLCVFVLGTVSACVPPGQIKKEMTPGHQKKHK